MWRYLLIYPNLLLLILHSWNDKFTYDIEYVEEISLQFDMKIFKWTIAKVIKKEDVNANQLITMEAFKGN